MGQMTNFGTGAPVKDGPRSVEPSGGSKGTRQDFGVTAPLASSPSSNKPSGVSGGTHQDFGTRAPLGSTPVKGFQGVPMSKRSIKQSQ